MAGLRSWSALGPSALGVTVICGAMLWCCSALHGLSAEPAQKSASAANAATPPDATGANTMSVAESIRAALLDTAARLDNLKITFVEKGDNAIAAPGMPIPVVFKEVWIHGQSAQARMDWRENGNGDNWWEGF